MAKLIEHVCPLCGVHYGLEERYREHRQDVPSSDPTRHWHCPNGHRLCFTESKADEQRRRAERAEQRMARIEDERNHAQRQLSAAKGQATRLRNRAANGVCPCCNRSFANLRRHMSNKHPDYKAEAA